MTTCPATRNATRSRFSLRPTARVAATLLAAALLLSVAASAPALAEPSPAADDGDASDGAAPPPAGQLGVRVLSDEQKVAARFETMVREYRGHLDSPDWIRRSLAVIGLGRIPTTEATELILMRFDSEKHPVARLVAWQAMLSRAALLSEDEVTAFEAATWSMIDQGLFSGDLRVGVLDVLSCRPITPRARAWFLELFKNTNSLDSADIPTLIAMGRALERWGDAMLVEDLLRSLSSPHTAVRAELVLQAAGATVEWNRTSEARKVYTEWWKTARQSFTAAAPPEDAFGALERQYCPAPVDPAEVLADPNWYDELELGALQLQNFDFAIAIDCSKSMAPEIERLKRDIAIMVAAFAQVAREPRVGVTLFAPGALVKCQSLTGSGKVLGAFLRKHAQIFGPAGDEEWAGALEQTITESRWVAPGERSRRFIALISDEPITKEQFVRSWDIARQAAQGGFRIYGVRVKPGKMRSNPLNVNYNRHGGTIPPPLPEDQRPSLASDAPVQGGRASWNYYDDLAHLTGALAIDVEVPQGGWGLGYLPPPPPEPKNKRQRQRYEDQMKRYSPVAFAPVYAGGGPTTQLLTMVLRDAINPQYASKVEPLVKTLVQYCQRYAASPPEKRTWGRVNPIGPNRTAP